MRITLRIRKRGLTLRPTATHSCLNCTHSSLTRGHTSTSRMQVVTDMVAYEMSSYRDPWSLAPQDPENNIPYLGGISATNMSIRMVLAGYCIRETHVF